MNVDGNWIEAKKDKKKKEVCRSSLVSYRIAYALCRIVSCRVVSPGELKSETLALNQEPKHSRKESVRELEKKHFH